MDEYIWFRKSFNGMWWRPVSVEGYLTCALWLLANIWYARRVDSLSHSISDTLIDSGIFLIGSTLILLVIIHLTKGRRWE